MESGLIWSTRYETDMMATTAQQDIVALMESIEL